LPLRRRIKRLFFCFTISTANTLIAIHSKPLRRFQIVWWSLILRVSWKACFFRNIRKKNLFAPRARDVNCVLFLY
jgi:hypothetical protein